MCPPTSCQSTLLMRGHQKDIAIKVKHEKSLGVHQGSHECSQPGSQKKKGLHGTKRQAPHADRPRKQLPASKGGNDSAGGPKGEYPYNTDYNDHFETSEDALAHIEPVLYRWADSSECLFDLVINIRDGIDFMASEPKPK